MPKDGGRGESADGRRNHSLAHLNDEYAYIYTKRARIRTFICAHLLLHIVYRAPHSGYKTNKIKQTPTGSVDVSYLMSGLVGREAVFGWIGVLSVLGEPYDQAR